MATVRGKAVILCPLLLFFNLIFMIFGIGIIIGGFLTLFTHQDYAEFIGNTGRAVFIVLIFVGFIIIFVPPFGCFGTVKLDQSMLKKYSFCMVVIIILELGAGIAGYVLRDDIDKLVDDNMRYRQREYNSSTPTRNLFDSMQQDLKCCGVDDYTDWMGWDADQPEILPGSCCKVLDTPGCFIIDSPNFDIYTDPCYPALRDLLLNNIGIIAGVAIGIAVTEIFVLVMVRCLMRKIMIRSPEEIAVEMAVRHTKLLKMQRQFDV